MPRLAALLAALTAGAALAAAPAAQPCTFVVDGAAGSDAAAGTSAATAWRTVGRAAAAAGPGQTVCLRAGVYYETLAPAQSGTASAPVTFRAWPGDEGAVVLSGTDALAAGTWVRDGADWRWDWAPRAGWETDASGAFPTTGNPDHGAPHVIRRELLVARSGRPDAAGPEALSDGHPLLPVASRAALTPHYADDVAGVYGTVWVQTTAQGRPVALFARFAGDRSPAEAAPRLAVRAHGYWPGGRSVPCGADGQPRHVVLRGVTVRHTNNGEQVGAVCPGGEGSVLDGVTIAATNGTGLALGDGPTRPGQGVVVRDARVLSSGQLGVGGVCDGCTLDRVEIAANNWKGYHIRWEAGGLKLSWSRRTVLRRLHSHDNRGPGIWLDEGNEDCVVEGARSLDNDDVGLFVELFSVRTLVQHNLVARTRRVRPDDMSGTGLLVQAAYGNGLYWNTVVGNDGNGVFDRYDWRATAGFPEYSHFAWAGLHNTYLNNVVAGNAMSDAGLYADEAHELQVFDLRADWARTAAFAGNRVMSHDGDPDALQEALVAGWDQPAAVYDASNSLAAFRHRLQIAQPDGQALLPFEPTAYGALADLTVPLPDFGAPVAPPAAAPCAGPQCVVRCGSGVGAERAALTGDFLDRPETACRVGATAGAPAPAALALALAPNPARTAAEVRGLPDGPAEAALYDAVGRRVAQARRDGGSGPLRLDVRGLPAGVYAVRTGDGRHARLVVAR